MKKQLLILCIFSFVILLTTSCSKEEVLPGPIASSQWENVPKSGTTKGSNNEDGLKGLWDNNLRGCVSGKVNCASFNLPGISDDVIPGLEMAIDRKELSSYWNTGQGQEFLSRIDQRLASDLQSGEVTIMRYETEYLYLFPNATGPYDCWDYSKPTKQLINPDEYL